MTMTTTDSLIPHTCAVCLLFGSLCCMANSSLGRLFGARLPTQESLLFCRHFGLANVLIAFLMSELSKAGHITTRIKCGIIVWHGMVLTAFAYEFIVKRVWKSSPPLTWHLAAAGVVLHAIIFGEGLLEEGLVAFDFGGDDPSDWLRVAALECALTRRLLLGLASAASFAVIYDPLGRLLLRHQKRINDGQRPVVPRYWSTVLGSLVQIALWIAASTRFLPTFENVRVRAAEATALNTVPAVLMCMVLAEFGFYWSHRLLHSRALYRHLHVHHHRIEAPTSAYDALYQHPVEMQMNLALTYLPLAIVPIHIYAAAAYLYLSGFIAFVLNHSGRECEVALVIPFTSKRYVIWSTELHDDHHRHRAGNFGAQLWCFDEIFGTRIGGVSTRSKTKHEVGDPMPGTPVSKVVQRLAAHWS